MKNDRPFVYAMIAPATVCFLVISIYPILYGIFISFTDFNLMRMNRVNYIGLDNFLTIITKDRQFSADLLFTFLYVVCAVALSYAVGLGMALLMNMEMKGKSVFRALLLVPWVIPSVVAANAWCWILADETGIINIGLMKLGLLKAPLHVFAEPWKARLTVIISYGWKNFSFMMLMLLAGLQNIPRDLYESAAMDGAGRLRSFVHITMPMLSTVSVISTVLLSIWTFNNFENIYLLTTGGPVNSTEVISIYSYYVAFLRSRLGYASAISVIMMIIMIVMGRVYMKVSKER